MHGLSHVNLALELRMYREERCSVEFLKSGDEYDLQIFDGENIEMSKIELGSASINEKLPVYVFVKCRAVRRLYFWKLGEFLPWWWLLAGLCCSLCSRNIISREHIWVSLIFVFYHGF